MAHNALTRETRQDWADANRRQKVGTVERGMKRAEAWAKWMLSERCDITVPDGAAMRDLGAGRWDFTVTEYVRERYEPILGPRGGKKGIRHIPGYYETRAVCEAFTLPPHAMPCKSADAWHEAHQAGMFIAAQAA